MAKIPYNKRRGYERFFKSRAVAEQYAKNENEISHRYHYSVENVELGKYAIYKRSK